MNISRGGLRRPGAAKLKTDQIRGQDVLRSNAGNVEVDRRGTATRQLYESRLHWQRKIRASTFGS